MYDAWAQHTRSIQLARLIEQLANAKVVRGLAEDQLKAFTGSRGYGALLLEGLRAILPERDADVEAVFEGQLGGGQAGDLARRLNASALPEEEPRGEGMEFHQSSTRSGNGLRALARVAYQEIARDIEIVRNLAASIDSAGDPKATLDLQARLTAQNVKSVLVTARMMALSELARARRQLEEADRAERLRRMLEPRFINPSIDW